MQIKITKTKDLGVNPLNNMCRTGSRFSSGKFRYGTLAIYRKGVPLSRTFINKDVFRAALVENVEFLRNELGVEVKDLLAGIKDDIPEEQPETQQSSSVDDMSYPELKAYAEKIGVDFKGNIKKEKLIELIKHKEE